MPRRVLDTNILINHWGDKLRSQRREELSETMAQQWARELIALTGAAAILTPVYLEYICGQTSATRVRLARAYLSVFEVADQGRILDDDWRRARQIAERVPRTGHRRQLGDCLIRAICDRLNLDLFTVDQRFPH